MAFRCEDCGKMASVEVEVNSVDANDSGDDSVQIDVELSLMSACCGCEMATYSGDETVDIPATIHAATCEVVLTPDDAAPTYSVDVVAEEPTDWMEKVGKAKRHFYGVEGSITITCDLCSGETTEDYRAGEESGAFETTY